MKERKKFEQPCLLDGTGMSVYPPDSLSGGSPPDSLSGESQTPALVHVEDHVSESKDYMTRKIIVLYCIIWHCTCIMPITTMVNGVSDSEYWWPS